MVNIQSLQQLEDQCVAKAQSLQNEATRQHAIASDQAAHNDAIAAQAQTKAALVNENKAKNYLQKAARLQQQIAELQHQTTVIDHEIHDLQSRRSSITGE